MIATVIIIYMIIGLFDAFKVMGMPTIQQPLIATNSPALYLILSLFLWPLFMKMR